MSIGTNHDIVVLGASAGGVEALTQLLAALPRDLPASLFVVQHMSPVHQSRFPELLEKRGPFRTLYPVHGQKIEPRHVYVAPPDTQLLVRFGYLHVLRGPKENGHRPSVDALFRTAARAYGPRVIGVVLTGYLDCGTAGLLSIKARGGLALAQDPSEAAFPEMPQSAVDHVALDFVGGLSELAQRISELVTTPAGATPNTVAREISELEGDELGVGSNFVCPTCRGALTEVNVRGFEQFRCHVGHSFSLESVLSEQTEETERALWAAVRALEESASLAARMSGRSIGTLQERFAEKHETLARQADVIRAILLGHDRAPALTAE
jgi:two-component system chemotaxis response regulator CheB